MQLFHASKCDFVVGQVIEAKNLTIFYKEAVEELENHRPDAAPSRSICVFASESEDFAAFFLLKQKVDFTDIRIYSVELPIVWKSPFAIVHELHRRIERSQPTLALQSEYWNPKEPWKFYEFFGPRMIIKAQLTVPPLNEMILGFQYGLDTDRAKEIY